MHGRIDWRRYIGPHLTVIHNETPIRRITDPPTRGYVFERSELDSFWVRDTNRGYVAETRCAFDHADGVLYVERVANDCPADAAYRLALYGLIHGPAADAPAKGQP